jgi:SNF2 family DNA or RNA helicase
VSGSSCRRIALPVQIRSVSERQELRPYQQVGTSFLVTAGSAILGDEMRLGKSMQAIAACKALNALPALFVVPNSTKDQWFDYLEEWWPESRPIVVRGSATQRKKALEQIRIGAADVGIINWESLRLHSRQEGFGSVVALAKCRAHGGDVTEAKCEVHPRELNEIKFRAVVADEAHRAVHPRAKQTRALWAIAWEAEHRFALTGTPVLDVPVDIWALMHLVSPNEATQKTTWIDRYCTVGFNGFAEEVTGLRPDTKDELFRYVDPRFLRRTRKMVMPWLPEKIYTTRTVELGPKQRKAYDAMKKDMLAELDNGDITYVTNALSKLIRLRQFASAYAYIDENDDLKLETPSCKAEAMVEIAEELGGQPAVVWAESKQLVDITGKALARAGYTVGYVTGDVTDHDRALAITAFQRGDLQFMCATIGAGGEGITLDRADVCVFLQRSFSLAKNQQAEDRIVGQDAGPGLQVIDIVSENTIEPRVFEVLGEKERIVEEIVRDRATYLRLLGEG